MSAERTRKRIIDAATKEFARCGIAGARVDRIAAAAAASKPMIYSYFGDKDRLFDTVFETHVLANADRVPFTAGDLPGYAVGLYDDYLADPALVRLLMWKRLERDAAGYLYPGLEHYDAAHLRGIAEQQRLGSIRAGIAPEDIWTLLIATAGAWAQASLTTVAVPEEARRVHDQRREALREYVSGAVSPRSAAH